jgi:hypothetical protein
MEKVIFTLIVIALGCFSCFVITYCAVITICETQRCPELLTLGTAVALLMVFYFLIDTIKFVWKGGQE